MPMRCCIFCYSLFEILQLCFTVIFSVAAVIVGEDLFSDTFPAISITLLCFCVLLLLRAVL